MVKLLDRVKQAVSGTAASTTLGAAASGYRTFNTAGAATNDVCRYAIEDDNGAFEIGTIVINSATTGTRTVQISSNSNNALTLTGNAVIFATLSAADLSGNAAPIWTTTPVTSIDLNNDGSTAVTLTGVAIDEFPIQYSWDGYAGTSVYNDSNLPPQLASAPTFSGGTASLVGSSTRTNGGSFNFRLKASDGVTTATAATAVRLVFNPDLANASYDNVSFSLSSQSLTNPKCIAFSASGDKMYLGGSSTDSVFQYSLSTNWDLSTASYDNVSFSVYSQESFPTGLAFSADGDKMYIVGATGDAVVQYSLSTNWDLSTASYNNVEFSISGQEQSPEGLAFSADGDKMYVVGGAGDAVVQYSLSTNWDLSSASYNNVELSVVTQESSVRDLTFSDNGSKLFIIGGSDTVHQYGLTSNWDLSTASYDNVSFSVSSQESNAEGIKFNVGGGKMYIVGRTSDTVYQYSTD